MKKRLISALLCVVLTLSLCLPALAAETTTLNQELTQVTLSVKKALSIGDNYSSFGSDLNDYGLIHYWSLYWSDDDSNIQVDATGSGKIMDFYRNDYSISPLNNPSSYTYAPSFNKLSEASAEAAVKTFLNAVLTSGESAGSISCDSDNQDSYSFSVPILMNSLPTQVTAQLTVDSSTAAVSYFSRSDSYGVYVNSIPSAKPTISAADAKKTLDSAVKLEAQYVLSDDGTTAVLQYLPSDDIVSSDYVDAQTGALVDVDALSQKLYASYSGGGMGSAEASFDSGTSLTDTEQTEIQKLDGVLSKTALDAAVQKYTALGLSRYTLASTYYENSSGYYSGYDDSEDDPDSITCTLTYSRTIPASELVSQNSDTVKDAKQYKTVTVDAKTGALLSCYTWSTAEQKAAADSSAYQATADAFLALWMPEQAKKAVLSSANGADLTYTQKENGYFFYGNQLYVTLDTVDGSIDSFSSCWTENVTFEAPKSIVSAEQAQSTYCASYSAQLMYVTCPEAVDETTDAGKTYNSMFGPVAYRYALGYAYESGSDSAYGVDAVTGALLHYDTAEASPDYTDLDGSYAPDQINALAARDIRFSSSTEFQPTAQLTQADMLVLLLSANGYCYYDTDTLDDDTLNDLYNTAWSIGLLPKGEKTPTATVTRLDFLETLLGASPYGSAAKLSGIFVSSLSDASSVPQSELGYLAIAEGLGIIHGDKNRAFHPNNVITRQDAAILLYNYMSR